MALQSMQLVLAVASLGTAMAVLSVTGRQSTKYKQPEREYSLQEFINEKDGVRAKIADPALEAAEAEQDMDSREEHPISWLAGKNLKKHKASLTMFESHMHYGSHSHQRQAPGPPVEYIPKIGVGNVTTPTELPPPPPTLNPMTDMQPFDTALGNAIASSFLSPPTATPPPTQEALNLAYGCPVLVGYPEKVVLSAPTGCGSTRAGNWTHPQGQQIIKWTETCDIFTALLPIVKYVLPDGQAFGSSRTRFSFFGNKMEILDCGDNLQYVIEEKIYHSTKFVDKEACDKYKSCDGTVHIQYFMYDKQGRVVAQTPYLGLFQGKFPVADATGMPIAEVEKMGAWSPWDKCPLYKEEMKWSILSAAAPPGIFGVPENRWYISVMVNMMMLRDADRMASGMVIPTQCEIMNVVILAVAVLLLIILVIALSVLFYMYILRPARLFFYNMEQQFFPHTIYKPSKYEG